VGHGLRVNVARRARSAYIQRGYSFIFRVQGACTRRSGRFFR
jgi:hypothetical protein